MDGVAFADGIHHLIDEELETAAFVGSQRMGAGEVAIEVVERVALKAGFVGTIFDQDFPAVAGDRFFAFGDDVLEHVIAVLHGLGGEGELGEVAVLESIDLGGEAVEGEAADGIRNLAMKERSHKHFRFSIVDFRLPGQAEREPVRDGHSWGRPIIDFE